MWTFLTFAPSPLVNNAEAGLIKLSNYFFGHTGTPSGRTQRRGNIYSRGREGEISTVK